MQTCMIIENYLSMLGRFNIITLKNSIENLHMLHTNTGNANVLLTLKMLMELTHRYMYDPEFDLYGLELNQLMDIDSYELVVRNLPTNLVNDEQTNDYNRQTIIHLSSMCKMVVEDLALLVERFQIAYNINLYRANGYITQVIGGYNGFVLWIAYNTP